MCEKHEKYLLDLSVVIIINDQAVQGLILDHITYV